MVQIGTIGTITMMSSCAGEYMKPLPKGEMKDLLEGRIADRNFVPSKQVGMPRANGSQRPMLLTMQRINNVGVFLCRLKLTPFEAVAAIMACCGDRGSETPTSEASKEGGNAARELSDVELEGLLHCMPTEVRCL